MQLSYMNELHPKDREDSNILRGPFSVQFDGSWLNCVTDGHGILAVSSAEPAFRTDVTSDRVNDYLSPVGSCVGTVAWETFDGWLAGAVTTREVPCPKCNGKPLADHPCNDCDGEGYHECDRCKDEHSCATCNGSGVAGGCFACDSEGTTSAPALHGRIGREQVPIDRNVVARFLAHVPRSGLVTIHHGGDHDPVYFIGDGWRGAVMPYLHSVQDCPVLVYEPAAPRAREG